MKRTGRDKRPVGNGLRGADAVVVDRAFTGRKSLCASLVATAEACTFPLSVSVASVYDRSVRMLSPTAALPTCVMGESWANYGRHGRVIGVRSTCQDALDSRLAHLLSAQPPPQRPTATAPTPRSHSVATV